MFLTIHYLNHCFFFQQDRFTDRHIHVIWINLEVLSKQCHKQQDLFLTGAIAIGGIPPLNGFISEFLIYCGILKGINSAGIAQITLMIITFAGMSIIGGISILTFTKTFGTIFLGTPTTEIKHRTC